MNRGFYAIKINSSDEAKELAEIMKDEPVWPTSRHRLETGNMGEYKYLVFDLDQWTCANWLDGKTEISLKEVKQIIII